MLAITGATGQLGRLTVKSLLGKLPADRLVALVRSPEKAADLGIAAREFDYSRPETLDAGLKGVEKLLLISSSEVGQRASQHQNVIDAAKRAGVKEIIYTSLLHADTSTIGLAAEHRQTEAALKASGIPHTILRNGWYTENYAGSAGNAVASGAVIGSVGEGRISSATRADFAEAAATVLAGEGHAGKVYELGGGESYTLADLAAEISRQSGKPMVYNDLPEAEYAAILVSFGLPEGFAALLANSDVQASKGALFDDSRQLSALIGRPTTSLADAVAAALKG